jgi:CII-binding regulator of phage lambda lysogenization HflD
MQMALLEQLSNLMNQINKPIPQNANENANNNNANRDQCKCDNPTFLQQNLQENILEVIKVYEEHIKEKQTTSYMNMFENVLTKFDDHIHRFSNAMVRIENKLDDLTNIVTVSETRLDTLEKTDRSRGTQQKLTSFTGFAKERVSHNNEENIVLKIEETEKIEETKEFPPTRTVT